MIEEILKELTKYVENYINYLKQEEVGFERHLDFYLKLSCKIEKIFVVNKIAYKNSFQNTNYISYKETLNNVKKFLDGIDENYFKLLTSLINKGNLRITYNSESDTNNYVIMIEDSKFINVNFKNTLRDGRVLIHEFFHYLNSPDKYDELTSTRSFLTELISILFESLYLDSYKERDLQEYYNQKLFRYTNTSELNIISFNILLLLVCFQKFGEITIDNYKSTASLLNLKLMKISVKNLENVLSIFKAKNYEYMISNYFSYIIGFSLSCYIRKFNIIDEEYMKQIIEFNNNLKKPSNDSWQLLKSLDVDSDCQSFLDDVALAVQEEIQRTLDIENETMHFSKKLSLKK